MSKHTDSRLMHKGHLAGINLMKAAALGVCFHPQKYKQSIQSVDKMRTEQILSAIVAFLLKDICFSAKCSALDTSSLCSNQDVLFPPPSTCRASEFLFPRLKEMQTNQKMIYFSFLCRRLNNVVSSKSLCTAKPKQGGEKKSNQLRLLEFNPVQFRVKSF